MLGWDRSSGSVDCTDIHQEQDRRDGGIKVSNAPPIAQRGREADMQ